MKQIIFILVLFTFCSYGQDSLKSNRAIQSGRLLIGINISPDYCFRTIHNNDNSASANFAEEWRNKYEIAKLGYSLGLNACYNLSNKIAIEAGVQYSNKGYETKSTGLTYGYMMDPRFGFIYDVYESSCPQIMDGNLVYNFIYLDAPIRLILSLGKKRIRFITSIGVTTNFLLDANYTNLQDKKDGIKKRPTYKTNCDINKFNLTPTVSVGFKYRVTNKINIQVEPCFRYGVFETNDNPVTTFLWSSGLNCTVYYTVK